MYYLRRTNRLMALSLLMSFAIALVLVAAMHVQSSIAATSVKSAGVRINSTEVEPVDSWWNPCSWNGIKRVCKTVVKVYKTVNCMIHTPMLDWQDCF